MIQIRSWRGERVEELLTEIEHLARETSDQQSLVIATIARADRAFALGELDEAATAYRRAGQLSAEYASICAVLAARASLLARDATSAGSDLAALEATGVHGPAIEARRISISAGLAALEGRPADALSLYGEAMRRFRDLGVPLDEAFTAIEMVTLLGPTLPEVRAAADAAREILTRLQAQPFLERLERAIARPSTVIGDAGSEAAVETPAQGTQAHR